MWLAGAVIAVGVIFLAVWLAYMFLPFATGDRIATGLAVGTALDGLLAAWLTVHGTPSPGSAEVPGPKIRRGQRRDLATTSESPAPADRGRAPAPGLRARQPAAGRPTRLGLADLGRLTDLLLQVRQIRSPAGWQLLLDLLPDAVSQSTPRQATGRNEVIALLQTCDASPGAWDALDAAVHVVAPESPTGLAFATELERLRLVNGERAG